ncbi:hypothetical protein [Roseburia intestinalis]|jgi:hypothetical protein|uniref:hypothetical protein n=1 Tax=Roseburia intestinalis TaxID=166486 RepID=UPI00157017F2|nr:hypothetical protein [Roseburia intestinalis]NSC35216.1 hypothetical protein [Roseburia intestinalis]
MKSVKLSKLKFKDLGLDIKKNFLNPSKCECGCGEYGLLRCDNSNKLQDNICHMVCESGKYPCGVVVLRKDNTVLIGFSDKENLHYYADIEAMLSKMHQKNSSIYQLENWLQKHMN